MSNINLADYYDFGNTKYGVPMAKEPHRPSKDNPITKHPHGLTVKDCEDKVNAIKQYKHYLPEEQQKILDEEIEKYKKLINEANNE